MVWIARLILAAFDMAEAVDEQNPIPFLRHVDCL
jgi:hypothetical protein